MHDFISVVIQYSRPRGGAWKASVPVCLRMYQFWHRKVFRFPLTMNARRQKSQHFIVRSWTKNSFFCGFSLSCWHWHHTPMCLRLKRIVAEAEHAVIIQYSLIGLLQPRVEGKKTPNFWKHSHTYFLNSFWCKEIRRIQRFTKLKEIGYSCWPRGVQLQYFNCTAICSLL